MKASLHIAMLQSGLNLVAQGLCLHSELGWVPLQSVPTT